MCTSISKIQYDLFLLGTLNFVTLHSATTLPRIDDVISPPISIDGGFPFGTGTIYTAYVRKHSPCACVAVRHMHSYAVLCATVVLLSSDKLL